MSKTARTGVLIGAVVACIAGTVPFSGEDPPPESPFRIPKHEYTGVAGCKTCHKIQKLGGEEYKTWEKLAHARAFETLETDAARKIAAERGLGDPTKAPECLECHTTAFGVAEKWRGKKLTLKEGVSCEACHGPGKDYAPKEIMKDREKCLENGMVIPNEKTCRACHNEKSPTYREFDYEEALRKIRHWPETKGATGK